jgi:predicted small metal-binding protein
VRVIECSRCGDLVAAANDAELAAALGRHMRDEHPDEGLDDARAGELVAERAYDASDS